MIKKYVSIVPSINQQPAIEKGLTPDLQLNEWVYHAEKTRCHWDFGPDLLD